MFDFGLGSLTISPLSMIILLKRERVSPTHSQILDDSFTTTSPEIQNNDAKLHRSIQRYRETL